MRRDLIALHDDSRVWVYQSDTDITGKTAEQIRRKIQAFTMKWVSHGQELDCYGHLFHNRFIVLVADDTDQVSGCSIDSSVHFIKSLEQEYGLDFFNRLTYAYMKDDHFHFIHQKDFKEAYNKGEIDDDTLMVNNLVRTKREFLESWIVPLRKSWYMKMLA